MSYHFHGRGVPKADKVAAIAAVYVKGDTSEKIAEKLSRLVGSEVTRAAVIGFYHRNPNLLMKYPLRAPYVIARPKRSHEKKSGPVAKPGQEDSKMIRIRRGDGTLPPEIAAQLSRPDDEDSFRVPVLQLIARHCRWPTHFDKERGHLHCGHKRDPQHPSYCTKHKKRAAGGKWPN